MNIEALWRVPQKRLANLPNVVSRLVKLDMPWYSEEFSPRRLLFGLYVHYQNACKKIRELKSVVRYQTKQLDELRKQIEDLKDYEKQVVFAGYYAVITRFSWSCGDGCCSDSWYGYQVFGKARTCEYENGISTSNTYMSLDECQRLIKEKFGNIPISEDTQDV